MARWGIAFVRANMSFNERSVNTLELELGLERCSLFDGHLGGLRTAVCTCSRSKSVTNRCCDKLEGRKPHVVGRKFPISSTKGHGHR